MCARLNLAASSAVVASGSNNLSLLNCNLYSDSRPVSDRYANVTPTMPSYCDHSNKAQVKGSATLSQGVYCGDVSVNAGPTLTLISGIYYFNGTNLSVTAVVALGLTASCFFPFHLRDYCMRTAILD